MMLRNLRAELVRLGVTNFKTVADATEITLPVIYNKMAGKTEFNRSEMIKIRDTFFPEMSLDYLFAEDNQVVGWSDERRRLRE